MKAKKTKKNGKCIKFRNDKAIILEFMCAIEQRTLTDMITFDRIFEMHAPIRLVEWYRSDCDR